MLNIQVLCQTLGFLCVLLLYSCNLRGAAESIGYCSSYDFDLPPNVEPPRHPPDVCLTRARVELGRKLFYDARLSLNQTQSCSSCHKQILSFSDGLMRARGSTGQTHPRNALSLTNVGYFASLTWFNPDLHRLDNQTLIPFFAEDTPTTIQELSISGKEHVITARMNADPTYPRMFAEAFPGASADVIHIARALAAFQTTLISFQSPFDLGTMSEPAKRGQALFNSETTGCFHCHGGRDFNLDDEAGRLWFQNVGLYNVAGRGDYPDVSVHGPAAARATQGLSLVTEKKEDRGKFRTPSLRNVAVTGPYMHDGSVATLVDVIEIFNQGGRDIRAGAFSGDGRQNPNKDHRVRSLALTREQKADLLEFLKSLTDECFLNEPHFSDPAAPPPKRPAYCR
ncbi:MAG: di-heme enzyme [Spirochaetia bacterium]|nr:di-heme enzyme [Spirochaetia bacterium]